jgi:hypothetical protein
MKRSWVFASGDAFLPKGVRNVLETYILGDDTSVFYISLWSFVHMATGVVYGITTPWSVSFYVWLHTLWELWQIWIGMTHIHTLRGAIDVGVDTLMGVFGVLSVR